MTTIEEDIKLYRSALSRQVETLRALTAAHDALKAAQQLVVDAEKQHSAAQTVCFTVCQKASADLNPREQRLLRSEQACVYTISRLCWTVKKTPEQYAEDMRIAIEEYYSAKRQWDSFTPAGKINVGYSRMENATKHWHVTFYNFNTHFPDIASSLEEQLTLTS